MKQEKHPAKSAIRGSFSAQTRRFFVWYLILYIATLTLGSMASAEPVYHLQVASFRCASRAETAAQQFRSRGAQPLVKKVTIPTMGYWHRIYLGPFATKEEAMQRRSELGKKGVLLENAILRKKETAPSHHQTKRLRLALSNQKPVSNNVHPRTNAPATDNTNHLAKPSPMMQSASASHKASKSTGCGRNMPKGSMAMQIRHTFFEVATELSERYQTVTTGAGTTKQNVTSQITDKEAFPTAMHTDTLRIKYGLTDYLEVFADGGSAYTDLSQIEGIYGGGARLNLFSRTVRTFANAYAAIEGEWIGGALETTYRASNGQKWEKETDWSMFSAKAEAGLVMERFSLYGGVSWINYKEETTRLLRNVGAIGTDVVHRDELQEEENWGAFGGIDVRLIRNLTMTVEGQSENVKRLFGTVTYHF